MQVEYISHRNIDKKKWDACIRNAPNCLIYAYSYFLDIMSPDWDALVLNDYQTVMPLTHKNKYRVRYLSQPPFAQQCGIFGKMASDTSVIETFLDAVRSHFRFAEIHLNYNNGSFDGLKKKCNLILPLNRKLVEIESGFRKDLVQNIRKAQKGNLQYVTSNNFEEVVDLYHKTYGSRIKLPGGSFDHFKSLCIVLNKKNQLLIRKVRNNEGQLLACGLFMKDECRIYKTMTATLKEGRKLEANHLLLYELIKEFSEQDMIFDLSGSEVASIQSFLKKFGPEEQPYYFLKYNNLPSTVKWLKSIYSYVKRQTGDYD
ncbi:MAG: GNAT family N-acetyltransferase [Chitinophagaceae bacterium]|nr:GNAT family N-acetyltransferase [Chitinophagaceae bacterium]